jgi:hypothetical protein
MVLPTAVAALLVVVLLQRRELRDLKAIVRDLQHAKDIGELNDVQAEANRRFGE